MMIVYFGPTQQHHTMLMKQHNGFFNIMFKFISKKDNPPKVPKARPIEDFWSMLADKVYEGGWEATTELQLKRRISNKIKEIDMEVFKDMMKTIKQN